MSELGDKPWDVDGFWVLFSFRFGKETNALKLVVLNMTLSGWWLGTFFIFPYIGNHHPN